MEKQAYDFIENNEDAHWWFRGRKEIIIDRVLKTIYYDKNVKLLDYGCGSGYVLSHISKYIKNCTGLEKHNYNNFKFSNIVDDISKIESSSFDIIILLDVLEHIENEYIFIDELKKLLKKDGKLIITVPANQWMFSQHDVVNNHYRRYGAKQLKMVLKRNGLKMNKISYFNTILFLPAVIVRLIEKLRNKHSLDDKPPSKLLNFIFYRLFLFEKYLLRKINMPFGVSLIAVCTME